MEQLNYNLLFRWFVGLSVDDPVWVPTVFSKNRDRLLEGDIAAAFMDAVLNLPRVKALLSDEHFSVDGTLIQAWASMKSFRRKDGNDEPPAPGATANVDFHKRSARTRRTPRPPIRMRGWQGNPAARKRNWRFTGHLLMENRNGLVVDAWLTHATGTAEPEAALAMLEALPDAGHKTVGADKAYDTAAFVASSRAAGVTPHVAQNINAHRGSNIDGRTTRHAGYRISQVDPQTDRGGERLDQGGRRHGANQAARGGAGRVDVCLQGGGLQLDPAAAAAGDRMSLPGICPRPHQRLCGSGKLGENRPGDHKSSTNRVDFVFGRAFSAAC